jgi:hypothetical protein
MDVGADLAGWGIGSAECRVLWRLISKVDLLLSKKALLCVYDFKGRLSSKEGIYRKQAGF